MASIGLNELLIQGLISFLHEAELIFSDIFVKMAYEISQPSIGFATRIHSSDDCFPKTAVIILSLYIYTYIYTYICIILYT